MTTYTINIVNRSGAAKSYFAFLQPPAAVTPGGGAPAFVNAWATFPDIADGDFDSATYTPPVVDHGRAPPDDAAQQMTTLSDDEPTQFALDPDDLPSARFYVADGSYTPGQIIDTTVSGSLATIDFTGVRQTTATVTEEPDGSWSITYS